MDQPYESIEYGVLSIGRGNVSGGGWQPQVAGGGTGRGATVSRPRLQADASPTRPYPRRDGGFSGLRVEKIKS